MASRPHKDSPHVSIIVPVYNDPDGVEITVESLLDLTYPIDRHEIIVVDNGSTDQTPSIIEKYSSSFARVKHVTEEEVQSSYAARNAGIDAAEGRVLAFIDADMHVEPEWLLDVIDHLDSAQYLGCAVELYIPDGKSSIVGRYNRSTGFPVNRYLEQMQFAPTCCLIVTRSVVETVGSFDERLTSGGDLEFGHRVADAGFKQEFAAKATMFHPVRSSLQSMLAKELRVGRGISERQQYHPDRYGQPGVPPRPSGVKSPDGTETEGLEQLVFGALGILFTGIRALGYFTETARFYLRVN